VDPEEARVHAERVPVDEWEGMSALEPHQQGQLIAESTDPPGGWIFEARFRPGLSADQVAGFTDYVRQRVEMFLVVGPDADGWFRRTDGGWQVTVAVVDGPDDPFL
jgi:hypothetical protein